MLALLTACVSHSAGLTRGTSAGAPARVFHYWAYDARDVGEPPPPPQGGPCTPQRFSPGSAEWDAEDFIASWDHWRASLPRVPFYLYDGAGFTNASAMLRHYRRCTVGEHDSGPLMPKALHDPQRGDELIGVEWAFVRALVSHPWRVADAERAQLLVVPTFLGLEMVHPGCGKHSVSTLRAVVHGPLFRRRARDHLVLGLDHKLHPHHFLDDRFVWATFEAFNFMSPLSPRPEAVSDKMSDKVRALFQPTNMTKVVVPYLNGGQAEPGAVAALLDAPRDIGFFFGGGASVGHPGGGQSGKPGTEGTHFRPGYAVRHEMCESLRRGSERLAAQRLSALCLGAGDPPSTNRTCAPSATAAPLPAGATFCQVRSASIRSATALVMSLASTSRPDLTLTALSVFFPTLPKPSPPPTPPSLHLSFCTA